MSQHESKFQRIVARAIRQGRVAVVVRVLRLASLTGDEGVILARIAREGTNTGFCAIDAQYGPRFVEFTKGAIMPHETHEFRAHANAFLYQNRHMLDYKGAIQGLQQLVRVAYDQWRQHDRELTAQIQACEARGIAFRNYPD